MRRPTFTFHPCSCRREKETSRLVNTIHNNPCPVPLFRALISYQSAYHHDLVYYAIYGYLCDIWPDYLKLVLQIHIGEALFPNGFFSWNMNILSPVFLDKRLFT